MMSFRLQLREALILKTVGKKMLRYESRMMRSWRAGYGFFKRLWDKILS